MGKKIQILNLCIGISGLAYQMYVVMPKNSEILNALVTKLDKILTK